MSFIRALQYVCNTNKLIRLSSATLQRIVFQNITSYLFIYNSQMPAHLKKFFQKKIFFTVNLIDLDHKTTTNTQKYFY